MKQKSHSTPGEFFYSSGFFNPGWMSSLFLNDAASVQYGEFFIEGV
jgi:hypothetical protein